MILIPVSVLYTGEKARCRGDANSYNVTDVTLSRKVLKIKAVTLSFSACKLPTRFRSMRKSLEGVELMWWSLVRLPRARGKSRMSVLRVPHCFYSFF
jgi:hypothetical protein